MVNVSIEMRNVYARTIRRKESDKSCVVEVKCCFAWSSTHSCTCKHTHTERECLVHNTNIKFDLEFETPYTGVSKCLLIKLHPWYQSGASRLHPRLIQLIFNQKLSTWTELPFESATVNWSHRVCVCVYGWMGWVHRNTRETEKCTRDDKKAIITGIDECRVHWWQPSSTVSFGKRARAEKHENEEKNRHTHTENMARCVVAMISSFHVVI